VSAVAAPYRVRDTAELAQKLALGLWAVLPRDALGDFCDLGAWKAAVRHECRPHGIDPFFVDIPRKDLTVVFNPAMPPTDEQVHESVRRVELDRWMGHQPGPELLVRTARGE